MEEIAYIGDDVNDLEVLDAVGFSAMAGNSPILDKFTVDEATMRQNLWGESSTPSKTPPKPKTIGSRISSRISKPKVMAPNVRRSSRKSKTKLHRQNTVERAKGFV